jgi:hypothetical protein
MREWTHVLALYQGKDSYRERNYYCQSIHRAAASAGLVRSTMLDRRRTAYRLAGTWRAAAEDGAITPTSLRTSRL